MSTRRIGVLNVVAVGEAYFPVTAENLAVALECNQVASESRSGAVDELLKLRGGDDFLFAENIHNTAHPFKRNHPVSLLDEQI